MDFVRRFAGLLFIIALPVALITSNIRLTVNEPRVYEYAADTYDTPATTGIARSELLRASGDLRDYFNNDEDVLFIRTVKDGESVSLFNARETSHLRDVKHVLQQTFRIQEAAVVFVVAYVIAVYIWAREASLRTLATQVVLSSLLGGAVLAVIGLVAVAGFDQFWNNFHGVLFDNDLWQLDPSRDRLIQMFPEDFWRDVSLWIGIGTMLELALLAAASVLYLGVTRSSDVTYDATLPDGARA